MGVSLPRQGASVVMMGLGVSQALTRLIRQRPQAILLTGGWANVPLALAASLLRIPMLIYLPDVEPGTTIKVLSKIGGRVAITVPESAQYFRAGQTVVTGYPLRQTVTQASADHARARFGLLPDCPTLLVTGGSRGARSINLALESILPDLARESVQIIHVTGQLDWERSQAVAHDLDLPQYHAYPYLDSPDMGAAFAVADIIIGRSGASVLGEFPYFGAASILVPYPYAWRYQRVNADWLVERGAGIRMDDADMTNDLLPTLQSLLHDTDRLSQLRANARALNRGNGAETIAQELLHLAGA